MFRRFGQLLHPFRREYACFVAGIALRQALVVVGGYSLVWALRFCLQKTTVPEWSFVAAVVVFDAGQLRFDLASNYFFSARISYPLFGKLRTAALEKVLRMPMEW